MADLAVWQRTIVDEEGNVVPGAEVEVRREEDDSLAALYADRAGETPLANPLAADMSGFVRFFAQGDAYTITAVGAGASRTWRFDPTGRLQEFDRISDALAVDDGADTADARSLLGTFSTVADVQNSHIPAVLESIRAFGRDAPGDGPPLVLVRGSEVPGAIQSADGQWWEDLGYNTITVRIPSMFPSLQEAFDHYSRLPMRAGRRIDLLIESGHRPTSGIEVSDGNYRHFWVRSEDPVVTLGVGFEGAFIKGTRADAPTLDCLIDMDGMGTHGVELNVGPSTIHITPGSGCINSGFHGLECRASIISGNNTIWTGAHDTGVRIQQGSHVRFNDADASNCGFRGFYVSRGSVAQLMDSRARNCGHGGGSGQSGAYVIRRGVVALSNTGDGIFGSGGSDGSGSTNGLWATRGAVVTADNGNFSDCEYGVRANDASLVDVRAANISGCTIRGIQATRASTVNANEADIVGVSGTQDVEIRTGSTVNLSGATTRDSVSPGRPNKERVSLLKFNTVTPHGIAYDSNSPDTLENGGYRSYQVTLSDDEATYFVPPHTVGMGGQGYLVAFAASAANPGGGLIWGRGTNTHITGVAMGHQATETTTGPLSGTTGTDGTFTFSAAAEVTPEGTESRFYMENRTGSSVTITITFLSSTVL